VRYHFKTKQGIETNTREEAELLAGSDPDYATRDLPEAIERGDGPAWRVCVQIMPEADAEQFHLHPFDLTKVWPHGDYPLIEFAELVLDRNPENYFVDIEQSAFEPSNIVPGIGFSPDKMLQARIFAYPDTHRYRLGVNYQLLPPNRPRATTVQNYQRDGFMRVDDNSGDAPNYEPNSMGGPVERTDFRSQAYGQMLNDNAALRQGIPGERRLHAARQPLPAHARGCPRTPDRQPRRSHGPGEAGDPGAADQALPQARPSVRRGCGERAGPRHRRHRC